MGGACGIYCEGGGDVHTGFWWGNLRERSCLETLGIYGSSILKGWGGKENTSGGCGVG